MMKCKADCLFNFDGKCTKQSKKDMTVIGKWKNDFKGFISELSMPEDDFNGIMQYIDEVPNEESWIPVSERLPEESGEYFVSVIDEYDGNYEAVGVAWFAHKKDYDIKESEWRELGIDETVIAWMPLPKPYEPQEGSDKE